MTRRDRSRLRGLARLGHDAVDLAVGAVEGHHRAIAAWPFEVLAEVPVLAPGAGLVREVHDGIVDLVYGGIRLGNRLARAGTGLALAED